MSSLAGDFVRVGITVLEVLFFAGIVGSAVVVVLTGVEDLATMFSGNRGRKATGTPEQHSSALPVAGVRKPHR